MGQSLFFGYQIPYIFIVVLSLSPLLALATPTLKSNVEKRERCGFDGDDNTYGLGIRIGIYLQWITTSIAYNFLPKEAGTMRGINNCFQAAMFAGLLFVTITRGPELYAVEAFMMLTFCMGGVCSGDSDTPSYSSYGATVMGSLIRFSLGMGFCAYGVWFTFKGMDNMKHPPCSTFVFVFARVNLYGRFRTLWKVSFTLGAISYAILILIVLGCLVIACWRALQKRFTKQDPEVENASPAEISNPEPDRVLTRTLWSTALLLFIVGVEKIIQWNHIQGVDSLGSTGQLLPLIIGLGGVFRIINNLLLELFGHFFKSEPARATDLELDPL